MRLHGETCEEYMRRFGVKYPPPPIMGAFILKLLSKKPMHGYQITEELNKILDMEIPRQIVYFALKKLESFGFLESRWVLEGGSKPRRMCSITDEGRKFLEMQIRYLKKLISLLEKF